MACELDEYASSIPTDIRVFVISVIIEINLVQLFETKSCLGEQVAAVTQFAAATSVLWSGQSSVAAPPVF